jgi:hypothetical protein
MTAPTDQFVQLAQRGQEAVTAATRAWVDVLQSFAGVDTRPTAAVDAAFDAAERVLADQREFVKTLVTASVQVAETVFDQGSNAAKTVAEQASKAQAKAADAANRAAESASRASKKDSATGPTADGTAR